eukprot:TRINITY_DN3184_c1_g2_i1.p1 TRINITY_DN3184_c1_g2~~TRINITY_DN3184_c1_g2_i1.p1  ORF type:complete len:403 (-),score=89.35 TRINITY_DN3184_c1_g2_i1:1668-2876(-)
MPTNANKEPKERNIDDSILWKINEENEHEIRDIPYWMQVCDYSPNNEYLAVGCSEGYVLIIDIKERKICRSLKDHTHNVLGVAFSKNGELFATCSEDKTIVLYNFEDFTIVAKFSNDSPIYGICFSVCSNFLYSGDWQGYLLKCNLANFEIVCKTRIHFDWISNLCVSSNGNYLLSTSFDCTANLICLNNLTVLHTYNHDNFVFAIDFHPTKQMFVAGDFSRKVKFWSIDDLSLLHEFEMKGSIVALCFLTCCILLVMSDDGCVTTYNVDTFQEIQRISSSCDSDNFVFSISSDSTHFALGCCEANIIQLFSLNSPFDACYQTKLIQLSKGSGNVLSYLVTAECPTNIIRKLVCDGICMNQQEHEDIVSTCWDLVEINEKNGGNMFKFGHDTGDVSDESDDD